jgi:hypothetical protein
MTQAIKVDEAVNFAATPFESTTILDRNLSYGEGWLLLQNSSRIVTAYGVGMSSLENLQFRNLIRQ